MLSSCKNVAQSIHTLLPQLHYKPEGLVYLQKLWRWRYVVSPSIVPSENFAELNRTVTCVVLKANDRCTSCPCHDEFRGPRSDYVRQYGGYDTRLVMEWVRILSKAWVYLREKKSDFRLKWIPVSKEKQRTSSVLCWDHRL
ncbi:hypothetical protein TNCV_106871 [Trichonephila clavipes]|nr:hypothetical protein TNCV_106871 [Trichonephila clavipes]